MWRSGADDSEEVPVMIPAVEGECWIEPETGVAYPTSYSGYRRMREAEEKWQPRHRCLAPDIDLYVWNRWGRSAPADADVALTFRPGASPRIQRMVGEVVRAIGRGRPAAQAMRHTARRFGLRHGQIRAFISAGIALDRHTRPESVTPHAAWSSSSLFGP
jgi:hypothetical protein